MKRLDHNNLPAHIIKVSRHESQFKNWKELLNHACSNTPKDYRVVIEFEPGIYPMEENIKIPDYVQIVGALNLQTHGRSTTS